MRSLLDNRSDIKVQLQFVDAIFKEKNVMLIIAEKSGKQHVIYMNRYSRFMLGLKDYDPAHIVLGDIFDVRDIVKIHQRINDVGKRLHTLKLKSDSNHVIKLEFLATYIMIGDRIFFILEQNQKGSGKERDEAGAPDKGKLLRMAMSQKNINGRELSLLTGVSEVTISKLRNGKVTNPQINTVITIAEALGVSVRDIWRTTDK